MHALLYVRQWPPHPSITALSSKFISTFQHCKHNLFYLKNNYQKQKKYNSIYFRLTKTVCSKKIGTKKVNTQTN